MNAPGSIIGFGLVFFLCTWATSLLAGLWLRTAAGNLRRRGAWAEKRAAALALIVPPVFGAILTFCLVGFSVVSPWFGFADHCASHGQHLHLCIEHGGAWADRALTLSFVSGLSAILSVRLIRLALSVWEGHRRLRVVEASSVRIGGTSVPVFQSPSERAFCFVAGLRSPRIYVAASLWQRLSADEREAMLAHERAHVANGDLWSNVAMSVAALFGAPVVAAECKRLWSEATERLCDRIAAEHIGESEAVASALLNLARAPRLQAALSFFPRPECLEDRVLAVLSPQHTGEKFAARMVRIATASGAVAALAIAVTVESIHHTLETVLGLI